MLKTLAEKYGFDLSSSDWEVKIFNHLCGFLDIEQEMIELVRSKRETEEKLFDKECIEEFLCEILVNPKESITFKGKIKHIMEDKGLSLDFKNDRPFIKVKPRNSQTG